ncbi:hypothetical protein F0U60_11960 [Archangium minus]|uniref:Peptidase C-terminal archaeal/bacterial domain-containing protein n=1 Tax=Archangium minus TaxID=83450 RepID=A0ABY9WPJ4_9BACT|nr:hypothetical protein F0U60_11960 [Archangium minus]
MRHQILTALLALPLVACGVEGRNAEQTESTATDVKSALTACSTPLSNGVTVTGISVDTDAWSCTYTLEVPEGAGKLSFDTLRSASGRGSAYTYVRYGAEPTEDTYDCYPGRIDANCTFLRPRAGTWYVKLLSTNSGPVTGMELRGTYTLGIPSDSVLTNGVETAPYQYTGGVWKCFTLDVPSGKTSLVFNERLTRGSWNVPPYLYVRYGEQPTTNTYTCQQYPDFGLGTCTINNPAAGTWFACSYGDYPMAGVIMKGTYN